MIVLQHELGDGRKISIALHSIRKVLDLIPSKVPEITYCTYKWRVIFVINVCKRKKRN